MKNKYYIPDISEFHVGFEYEFKHLKNDEWKQLKFDTELDELESNPYGRVEYLLQDNNLRVKYLNSEDIKSLGFKQINEDTYELEIREYRGIKNMLVHIIKRATLLIAIGDKGTSYSDWNTIFTGNIKNKSELKKLLNQLNIIDGK